MKKGVIVIAIYFRVSTSKQETAAQRQAVMMWCQKQGYRGAEIQEYTDDAISGATLARPAFQKMMADVRAGKIDKIVTFELSRLSRDFLDSLTVMKILTESGVEVEVPGEGVLPFHTTMEQFVVAAKSLVAAQERERISDRTKAGLAAARARGVKFGRPKPTKEQSPKRGWRKVHDPVLIEKILLLHRKGNSTHTIAAAVGETQNKVFRILQRHKDENVG